MTHQTRPTNDRPNGRNDEDLLTMQEVSAILRTPVATLRYWRYLGIGPCSFKIGRRVVYRRGDIDTWLREQEAADQARLAG
jgi:hypothetical protein